jgi:phosphoribosylamine---glycine ligase
MGSYSPPGFFSEAMIQQVTETILKPTIKAMALEGMPYKGVLYTGLMMTEQGPKVLEYNARFGDPETQAILPRLDTDLIEIIMSVIKGSLHTQPVKWSNDACVGVVMASAGYPGTYKTGFPVKGINSINKDVKIFHAGTKLSDNLEVLTDGGRVLTIVATGRTIADARNTVYDNIAKIHFEGCFYRKDIALREVH